LRKAKSSNRFPSMDYKNADHQFAVVGGSGREIKSVNALIQGLAAGGHVVYPGYLPDEGLPPHSRYYAWAYNCGKQIYEYLLFITVMLWYP
jgi:hypothetical protein